MTATFHKYILNFKQPSGTSRGVLKSKETWFIVLDLEGKRGIGECPYQEDPAIRIDKLPCRGAPHFPTRLISGVAPNPSSKPIRT
jgi:hypothetical protein